MFSDSLGLQLQGGKATTEQYRFSAFEVQNRVLHPQQVQKGLVRRGFCVSTPGSEVFKANVSAIATDLGEMLNPKDVNVLSS